MQKPTIGLCMIVRNEEANLRRCLGSVDGVFDQIVVVDTGSTDNTKNVAKSLGAEIYDFKWVDDFSAARNFSFSKCRSDYIMWLDADDIVLPESKTKLQYLKTVVQQADCYLMIYDYAQDDFGKSICSLHRHRVLKNDGTVKWKWPIHECLAIPPSWRQITTDIIITHKRSIHDVAADSKRNITMLRKAVATEPNEPRLKFYFAKELFSEGLFEESLRAFEDYFRIGGGWHDDQMNGHLMVALAHLRLGEADKAIDRCMVGIKQDPRWAEFFVTIGQIYYDKEQWENAARWFEIANRMPVPNVFGTVLYDNYTHTPSDRLCKCYSQIGKIREAYEANEKALAYRPTDQRMLYNREYLRDILFPGRVEERPIRLSLGSGGKPTPSYRCTDQNQAPNIVELIDQTSLPYLNGTVHAIYSEHALEHVGHTDSEKTIAEWARALRYGGHLWLKVPDLDICCQNFISVEDREKGNGERFSPKDWFKYTLYGIQDIVGDPHPESQFHKTGFTQKGLQRLLEQNGFEIQSNTKYDGYGTPSIDIKATQTKQRIKVAWMIPGTPDESHGSLRIRRLNIHKWLLANGVDSRIIDINKQGLINELRFADIVVFMSFGPIEKALIEQLRRYGVSVLYDHAEDLFDLPYQTDCYSMASLIVCCSTILAQRTKHLNRVMMLPDPFEVPLSPITHQYNSQYGNGKLRVVWCGYGGNAAEARVAIKPIIEDLGMELRVISEWDDADVKWAIGTWLGDLNNADIIISPQRHWLQPAKSNNKVTQAMSLGLPVLASPLESYKEAIVHGENGFLCFTPDDWRRDLAACKDATTRKRIGEAAKASVFNYSIDVIGAKWLNLLKELCRENCGSF